MSFSADIAKFSKKAAGNADKVVRGTVLSIGESLLIRTPVGNPTGGGPGGVPPWKSKPPPGYVGGHAKAGWQHSTGSPKISEVPGVDKDGSATLAKITASVAASLPGQDHYITNSVPYIRALEDGHSHQAKGPYAIVGRTVVEFGGIVEKAAAKVNK